MFYVAGYQILYPPKSEIYSKIGSSNGTSSLAVLESNILPIETFIHIGLFILSSITYWRVKNILAFSMCKMGCYYIFVHSFAILSLLARYTINYYQFLSFNMKIYPWVFSFWFLIPSILGFLWISQEHENNLQLSLHLYTLS